MMKTVTVVKLYKTPFDKYIKGIFCVRSTYEGRAIWSLLPQW